MHRRHYIMPFSSSRHLSRAISNVYPKRHKKENLEAKAAHRRKNTLRWWWWRREGADQGGKSDGCGGGGEKIKLRVYIFYTYVL